MKFHLNYTPPKSEFEINHSHKIFMIGSCFSENMGKYLSAHKFQTQYNSFGVLFEPNSILHSLQNILNCSKADETFFLEHHDTFYSYQHHSHIRSHEKDDLIETINSKHEKSFETLKTADVLIITFGTAFYYHHKKLNAGVANCHKQPSDLFEKRKTNINRIIETYSKLIEDLLFLNPKLKIIFTVSPVKYLKDGVVQNNISKSILLLAIHRLVENFPQDCFYFPAYELINDDLRDYRFYKEDLAHPNEQAIEYVWQKFSETYFSEKTMEVNQEIEKLNAALKHRVMNEHSLEYKKLQHFISAQREKIKSLEPNVNVD
ncbi:MAG: GSCFA domain-containing protein [Bacteroidetes bacterium]|nr:GSCFA domain-containing protein [Bacteroidota bacterium]